MSATRRVVSLVPSITETLRAWGIPLLAVTRFCEAPGVTTVGGTKTPDIAAIITLRPDVVLMDREENRAEDAAALQAAGVQVHATHVRSVGDVAPEMAALAAVLDADPVEDLAFVEPSAAAGCAGPRAWVPIWRRPWMTIGGGTYGSSLLAVSGIVNVCDHADDPYPTMDLTTAAGLHPDVVLAPSEPYHFTERHRSQLEEVAPVVFVDGQDLFWWGVRTPGAVARLADLARRLPR